MEPAPTSYRIEVHGDHWQRGRYRVELAGQLPAGLEALETAMESLGYVPADVDQWGRSYRHREEPHSTAEVDELADGVACVRVVLGAGNLVPADVCRVREELARRYRDLVSAVGTYRQDEDLTSRPRTVGGYPARWQCGRDEPLQEPIDAVLAGRAYS